MRRLLILIGLLLCAQTAFGFEKYQNWVQQGGQTITTAGIASTSFAQRSFLTGACSGKPCITVYDPPGQTSTLATIYSDNGVTPLANPFAIQGATTGQFFFYAAAGHYDVRVTATGMTTYTLGDVVIGTPGLNDCTNFPGANAGAQIAACVAALPSTGGTADARGFKGAQTWSAPVAISRNTNLLLGAATYTVTGNAFSYSSGVLYVRGLDMGQTTIALSGTSAWNFNPAYVTSGMGFSNLSVTSTSTSSDAVPIGNASFIPGYVDIHDVKITGPGGTTGSADGFAIAGIQVSQLQNIWIFKYPGDCLHIDAEGSGETHFINVNPDSCGDWGIHILSTTVNQSGGYTFTDSIISNRDLISGSGGVAVQKASGAQAQLNFTFIGGGSDNIKGGPAMLFKNTSNIKVIGAQVFQADSAGTNCNLNAGTNCYAGIHVFNVNNAIIAGNTIASNSRTVAFEDVVNAVVVSGNVLLGDGTNTVGYFIETGTITKGYIDTTNTTTIGGIYDLGMMTNSPADMLAARSTFLNGYPDSYGNYIQGTSRLCALTGATPCKNWKVESGVLRLFANDNSTRILQVGDDGTLEVQTKLIQPSADTWAGTATITNGQVNATVTFPVAYGSVPSCTMSPRADPGVGVRWYKNANTAQLVVTMTSASVGSTVFDYICVGNPN